MSFSSWAMIYSHCFRSSLIISKSRCCCSLALLTAFTSLYTSNNFYASSLCLTLSFNTRSYSSSNHLLFSEISTSIAFVVFSISSVFCSISTNSFSSWVISSHSQTISSSPSGQLNKQGLTFSGGSLYPWCWKTHGIDCACICRF